MTFIDIAEPLAKMGVPITPVRAGTKRAFLPDFPTTATTDLTQLAAWDKLYSDCNAACVARAEVGGIWFWEMDSQDVMPRIAKETGHNVLTEINTFRVRSRPGRGHFYFRHNSLSLSLGNISQTYVVGQDWSVRTNREYVVAPGSIHPDTLKPYEALNWGTEIAEAPEWLVDWLLSQKIQKQTATSGDTTPRNERGKVPHGSIHGFLLHHAGRLRNIGMTQEEIEVVLLRMTHEQCEEPIDDDKVRQMSRSICNFPAGENKALALTQNAAPQPAAVEGVEPEEELDLEEVEYPVFPRHVMFGTSIYEGFVKPYCDVNSRIDYFMWMPCAAMAMNYLGTKVSVPLKSWKPSFYMVLIGKAGEGHKSSSIKDAMQFLSFGGSLVHYSKDIKSADGRSIVWEVGSTEGLGTDMQRTNCKNAILYYDELSALVSKARIEGSSLASTLLKMYESASFGNSIKAKKDTFNIAPNTYCASLITATTSEKFNELWAQLSGQDTGLNERFTFILQPKELPSRKLETFVNYNEAALATRKVMDYAVNKASYQFFDQTPLHRVMEIYGSRVEIRAEKWALYFAIDLGLEEIDEDCVARGIEMAKYEQAVIDYLEQYEAKNDESAIQQGIMHLLKRNNGQMLLREVERNLNSNRYGLSIWNKALYTLANTGYVALEGRGIKGDPKTIRVIRNMVLRVKQ
jgi:hypothetical protein